MGNSSFGPLFYQADQKYGFRPGTTGSLAYIESHYNPKAVSPQGAQGLMQLMPSTAHGLGVSNPFDPSQAVDGGARYFKQGLDSTGGDYAKAAMYYHGGPNTSIWGPKTHAYADNFLGRLNALQPPQTPYYPEQQGTPPVAQSTMPPQSLGQMSAYPMPDHSGSPMPPPQMPQSLGQMAGGPPPGPPVPPQHHSKFTAGNIMGVLGDALSAYGGKQPTFGPFLREQQMMDKQQGFEREKYQQQVAMQLYMMSNGLDTDIGKKLLASGVRPGTPEWAAAMKTSTTNSLDPIVITPQGPMMRSQITGAGTAGGAPAPPGVTFTPIGGQ